MRILYLLISLLVVGNSYASSSSKNCFVRHVKEAIALNKARRTLYINRDKRARGVSRSLVLMERVLLAPARILDLRAKKYQKNGISIICSDLIDMSETPNYNTRTTQIPTGDYSSSFKPDPTQIKKELHKAFKEKKFKGINRVVKHWIERLEADPQYNCLLRHFLESIHRSAHLSKRYQNQALEQGIKAPDRLLWSYINLHLTGLKWANKIDKKAAPLQEQGIPILCQDVPAIPLP